LTSKREDTKKFIHVTTRKLILESAKSQYN